MNNFKFSKELTFLDSPSPFEDLYKLTNIGENYIRTRNPYVYDGPDPHTRAALLFSNALADFRQSYEHHNAASTGNVDNMVSLLPILEVIIDANVPICVAPIVTYRGRAYEVGNAIPFSLQTTHVWGVSEQRKDEQNKINFTNMFTNLLEVAESRGKGICVYVANMYNMIDINGHHASSLNLRYFEYEL